LRRLRPVNQNTLRIVFFCVLSIHARFVHPHNVQGVIINGAIRDSVAIGQLPVGCKALTTNPTKSNKAAPGTADVTVEFSGLRFTPGHWVRTLPLIQTALCSCRSFFEPANWIRVHAEQRPSLLRVHSGSVRCAVCARSVSPTSHCHAFTSVAVHWMRCCKQVYCDEDGIVVSEQQLIVPKPKTTQ
jgi:Aldolase/RraA